ncbi:Os11g0243100 [Oryza sativa Japonica Group]|uniref:Os11g0243100 protein n=1 Tax=Oryza sativa subsp. japonica TaxID=39947 RepID=A0A0N7KSP5_ORYSJ|nr:Os11g0243100 [Oryza sativa Japonica Group]
MDNISRMESAPAVSADMEWCDEFGLGSEEWTTKVEIKIRNVPEHVCHPEKMERLVSSFCDAQTHSFDAMKKEYYICGFARSIESIPKYKYLKIKYGTENGVRIKFFMLNLEATPYVDLEKDVVANEKDPELYEDPDVVREAFESQVRLQRIAEGAGSKAKRVRCAV